MKAFLILVVIFLIGAIGFVVIQKLPQASPTKTPTIEVTLTGVLTEVTSTSEYSFVLKGDNGSTGINSMKIDLKKYANKKVTIMGQYSGSVLYADTVTEVQ